ncbi:ABC transporter permease [Cryptosporangium japonicum]|uniref:ABC transporter permease n=1 Tax=Cryptosporangium japonicum TaxID=80872 RepID=A0ABN0U6K2_9ACTN
MRRVLRPLQWVWLLVVVLLVWELLTRTIATSLFVPPVSEIVRTFGRTWFAASPSTLFLSEEFRTNVLPSIGRIAAGYSIASVVGIGGGILLGVWRPAGAFFNPLIRLGMSVPVTALLPLAIVVFGITNSMNVFLIALGCLWPILINAYDGARGIDGTMTLTARSMQLSRRRYFLNVLLPGASPAIVAGMRVSVGTAMVLMVVSELYAATSGLGYYLTQQQRLFRFPQLWSAILLIALLGILANAAFAALERSALRWHHAARGESR